MATKSRSTSSESSNSKTSPATPKITKISKFSRVVAKSDTGSPSPLHKPRLSVDRSPQSVNSKPNSDGVRTVISKPTSIDRRSPKPATPTERSQSRVFKGSELHAPLSALQEDLKKAKEQLALVEKEKAQAIDELKVAQKLAEQANEKLESALVAQKRAEEISEIEKFRAVELEQVGIEAAQKKEDEWKEELECIRNKHALDASALFETTQALQRVKQELAMSCDAKNQALSHADDATKIAEIHAEKVEILLAEVTQLKGLLNSKCEMEANEYSTVVSKLKLEIGSLKSELEKTKIFEEKLIEKEASFEQLNVELEASKMSESYAHSLAEEWKGKFEKSKISEKNLKEKEDSIEHLNIELETARMAESYAHNLVEELKRKIEELESQVEEANELQRFASESSSSVMKQLEATRHLLQNAESEVKSLGETVGLLEILARRQKAELEESEHQFNMAKEESSKLGNVVESLKNELEIVKEEKTHALNNEKLTSSSVQCLLEEKNKLINDLESSRYEEEKSKKAMESLTSALHEVSAEAREAKEKLLSWQSDYDNYENQIEDLKFVLRTTTEKYESLLDDAKHEINLLTDTVDQSKKELEKSKAEWHHQEFHLVNCMKKSEEENSSMENELNRVSNLLKIEQKEFFILKEEGARLKDSLKEFESEVGCLKQVLGETKEESMKLRESLLEKESTLQNIIQENEELRSREADHLKKAEHLTKLLEEATDKEKTKENGELSDSEKDYDLLPKVVEFSEENGHGGDLKSVVEKSEIPIERNDDFIEDEAVQHDTAKCENGNKKTTEDEREEKEDNSAEVEFKMWESCKIEERDYSTEREHEQESMEDEVSSKAEGGESYDQTNGSLENHGHAHCGSSVTKLHQQKKSNQLLRKFGGLLKKKSVGNKK